MFVNMRTQSEFVFYEKKCKSLLLSLSLHNPIFIRYVVCMIVVLHVNRVVDVLFNS